MNGDQLVSAEDHAGKRKAELTEIEFHPGHVAHAFKHNSDAAEEFIGVVAHRIEAPTLQVSNQFKPFRFI